MPEQEILHSKVNNEKGRMVYLPKGVLYVDHDYQRDKVSKRRIERIAAAWSWIACGVLIVSKRPDGTYWVIDGQHRKFAAEKLDWIDLLPCIVFNAPDVIGEAEGFVQCNTDRGPVDSFSKYKALLLAGDQNATFIEDVLLQCGYNVSLSGKRHTISCPAALLSAAQSNPNAMEIAFYIAAHLCAGHVIRRQLFNALFIVERHIRLHHKTSLGEGDVWKMLDRYDLSTIDSAIRERASKANDKSDNLAAEVIIELLNHGRNRKNRFLELWKVN